MLARRLLGVVVMVVPAVICRPAAQVVPTTNTQSRLEARPTETTSSDLNRELLAGSLNRLARAPNSQVTELAGGVSVQQQQQQNEIPSETLRRFKPPRPASKEERTRSYFSDYRVQTPPHAHLLVYKEPFFGTVNHGKIILGLQERRKQYNLPLHKLKSLRPYFPFFTLD